MNRSIFLVSCHIPGKENIQADSLSRNFARETELMLDKVVFKMLTKYFFFPEVDLMATSENAQLETFVSWHADQKAIASDAFCSSWKGLKPYIFPPFSLIPKVLSNLEKEETPVCMIIVPLWKSQHWFPKLLKLLTQHPAILPFKKTLLTIPNMSKIHPLWKELRLMACTLSGKTLLT